MKKQLVLFLVALAIAFGVRSKQMTGPSNQYLKNKTTGLHSDLAKASIVRTWGLCFYSDASQTLKKY